MRKATEDNRDLDQLAEYLESMDPTKVGFQNDDDRDGAHSHTSI